MFFDTHAHMDSKRYIADRKQLIMAMQDMGITKLVCPAISYESNIEMRNLFNDIDCIHYATGLHPNCVLNIDSQDSDYVKGLENMILLTLINDLANDTHKLVAIGETGLDFHRISRNSDGTLDDNGHDTLNLQYQWFRQQIEFSIKYNLPLILHIRNKMQRSEEDSTVISIADFEHSNAQEEALAIIDEYKTDFSNEGNGIYHCFISDDIKVANSFLSRGFLLGIGGAITQPDNTALQDIVREIPLEKIVLETDSPYMLPFGASGKRNTPLNLIKIAETVSQIKGISLDTVAEITTKNAMKLFRLD